MKKSKRYWQLAQQTKYLVDGNIEQIPRKELAIISRKFKAKKHEKSNKI